MPLESPMAERSKVDVDDAVATGEDGCNRLGKLARDVHYTNGEDGDNRLGKQPGPAHSSHVL
jgi:hypothetical protein